MLQKIDRLQNITRFALLLTFSIPFTLIFLPFVTPILVAAFVALGIEPILRKISSRSIRNKYFAFTLIALLVVFLLVPISLFSIRAVNALKTFSAESLQSSQFFRALFDLWTKTQDFGNHLTGSLGIGVDLIPSREDLFTKVTPFIIESTRNFLASMPSLSLSLFVFISVLILFTTRAGHIKKFFVATEILPIAELEQVVDLLKNSCHLILVSIFLIGVIQALIVSCGSLIFGYQEFFLIFAVTLFLSFVPVIGAAPVAILLSIISFINGSFSQGVGMAVVAAIAGTIDNVLKPYIFSGKSKNLHPLISLFGIIGAIMVFGLPGLLLGPLIMQITLELGPPILQKLVLNKSAGSKPQDF